MDRPVAARGETETQHRTSVWIGRGTLLVLILACTIAFSLPTAEPDLWGHVQYGRDLMSHGLPATATYTYTAAEHVWINHENLSELLIALGADTIGGTGLLIVKCLLGAAVIGLIIRAARRQGAGLLAICLLGVAVSMNLASFWQVRPHVLTYLLFALLLGILSCSFSTWQGGWHLPWFRRLARAGDPSSLGYSVCQFRCLWLAPILFAVWANTHGGFVAGLCIFLAYLVVRGVEAVAASGRKATGLVAHLAVIALVASLATFVNPYGFRLHAWIISSLGVPRPEITEWHPLSLQSEVAWPFAFLAGLTIAALLASRKSLDATHMAVLGVVAWQAISHQRHLPFLAILIGFWLPGHVQSLLERMGSSDSKEDLRQNVSTDNGRIVAVGLGVACLLLSLLLVARTRHLRVETKHYPVAAVQFMADHDMTGRLVVTYNWAQYVIAALGARGPADHGICVALDGRFRTCYSQEIIDQHFDFILGTGVFPRHRSPNSPPPEGGRTLRSGAPELVLVNRRQEHSVAVMEAHTDQWVLLYQDQVAQVWGRCDAFDDPVSDRYIPPHERDITDRPQVGWLGWPALPRPIREHQQVVDVRSDTSFQEQGAVHRQTADAAGGSGA